MTKDVIEAAFTLLTFKHIFGKINEHKIDMREVLENPIPNNLQKALIVLEFPKKCVITPIYSFNNKEIEFPITQFFCLEADYPKIKYSALEADYTFRRMSQNSASGYKINDILGTFLSKKLDLDFFKDLSEIAKKHVIAFDDRVRLFQKLAQMPQSKFKLTEIQTYFLKQSFPIILISENEDKIKLYDFDHQEYRSIFL